MTKFEEIIGKKLPLKVGDKLRQYSYKFGGDVTYEYSKVTYITLDYDPGYSKVPYIVIHLGPIAEGKDKRNYGNRCAIELDFDTLEDRSPIVINGVKHPQLQSMSEPIYEGAV